MDLKILQNIKSELYTLNKLLSQIPEGNVIERLNIESRKNEIEALLLEQPTPNREPIRARITFRGKPVLGTHGIFAEFGAEALNAFADAVSAIGSCKKNSLGTRGPLPHRRDYSLLVTGTALGSFGFELEEAPKEDMLFPEDSPVESAIEEVVSILEASIGTDEDLADAIVDTETRALEKLRFFLATIAKAEATCALEFNDEIFRFSDLGQIRRSEERLRQEYILEEDKQYNGKFLGALPIRRTFEFERAEDREIISGRISPIIEDVGEINLFLEKPTTIEVHSKKVGTGKPRYTLIGFNIETS